MLLIFNPVKAGIRLLRIPPTVIKTGKVAKVPVGFGFQLTAEGVQLLGIFYRKRKMMPYFFGCGDIKEVFHAFPIARRAGSVKGGPFSFLVKKVDRTHTHIYTYKNNIWEVMLNGREDLPSVRGTNIF